MADFGERRVEPRQVLVGRGIGTTPERIDELRRRAEELEKLSRAKPERNFKELIQNVPVEKPLSPKEKKQRKLPRHGPRPGLAHPAQRKAYGRKEESKDPVILKG